MSRTVRISLPAERMDRLIDEVETAEGVVGMARQRGASVKPRGDVLTLDVTTDGFERVQRALDRHEIGAHGTVLTSEPSSFAAPSSQYAIERQTHEASWPEMASLLRRETNVGINYLMAMFAAGMVAAVGLWTDTLHLVVGAMVIAPGFEPIVRVPFGLLIGDGRAWRQGLTSTAAGYGAILAGAVLTAAILAAAASPDDGPLAARQWVRYWSQVEAPSLLVAVAAGAGGAAIIAAQRSVLSAGVMIALALVPGAALVGMGLALGEFAVAAGGATRWAADVVCVTLGGGAVFLAKRVRGGRRPRRRNGP